MGRASQFISFLNQDYISQNELDMGITHFSITDEIKKARREYRSAIRRERKNEKVDISSIDDLYSAV